MSTGTNSLTVVSRPGQAFEPLRSVASIRLWVRMMPATTSLLIAQVKGGQHLEVVRTAVNGWREFTSRRRRRSREADRGRPGRATVVADAASMPSTASAISTASWVSAHQPHPGLDAALIARARWRASGTGSRS